MSTFVLHDQDSAHLIHTITKPYSHEDVTTALRHGQKEGFFNDWSLAPGNVFNANDERGVHFAAHPETGFVSAVFMFIPGVTFPGSVEDAAIEASGVMMQLLETFEAAGWHSQRSAPVPSRPTWPYQMPVGGMHAMVQGRALRTVGCTPAGTTGTAWAAFMSTGNGPFPFE